MLIKLHQQGLKKCVCKGVARKFHESAIKLNNVSKAKGYIGAYRQILIETDGTDLNHLAHVFLYKLGYSRKDRKELAKKIQLNQLDLAKQTYCLIHMLPINIVDGQVTTVDVSKPKTKKELDKPLPTDPKTNLRIPLPICTRWEFEEYMTMHDEDLLSLRNRLLEDQQVRANSSRGRSRKNNRSSSGSSNDDDNNNSNTVKPSKERQYVNVDIEELMSFIKGFGCEVTKNKLSIEQVNKLHLISNKTNLHVQNEAARRPTFYETNANKIDLSLTYEELGKEEDMKRTLSTIAVKNMSTFLTTVNSRCIRNNITNNCLHNIGMAVAASSANENDYKYNRRILSSFGFKRNFMDVVIARREEFEKKSDLPLEDNTEDNTEDGEQNTEEEGRETQNIIKKSKMFDHSLVMPPKKKADKLSQEMFYAIRKFCHSNDNDASTPDNSRKISTLVRDYHRVVEEHDPRYATNTIDRAYRSFMESSEFNEFKNKVPDHPGISWRTYYKYYCPCISKPRSYECVDVKEWTLLFIINGCRSLIHRTNGHCTTCRGSKKDCTDFQYFQNVFSHKNNLTEALLCPKVVHVDMDYMGYIPPPPPAPPNDDDSSSSSSSSTTTTTSGSTSRDSLPETDPNKSGKKAKRPSGDSRSQYAEKQGKHPYEFYMKKCCDHACESCGFDKLFDGRCMCIFADTDNDDKTVVQEFDTVSRNGITAIEVVPKEMKPSEFMQYLQPKVAESYSHFWRKC